MIEQTNDVVVERQGAVLVIRLNRTQRNNAIGGSMLRDLAAAFDEAAHDDAIRVVLTAGNGKHFCVGADAADLEATIDLPGRELLVSAAIGGDKGLPTLSADEVQVDELGNSGRMAQRLWALEKPTIAAITGAAVGGGLALAMLHDIRIAATDARLNTGFASLGLAPEMGISYVLPRVVSASTAADLLFRSEILSGEAARELGLVSEALPAEDVFGRALELAEEIAAKPALATRWAKRLLRRSMNAGFDEQLRTEYHAQVSLFDQSATRDAIRATLQRVGASKR